MSSRFTRLREAGPDAAFVTAQAVRSGPWPAGLVAGLTVTLALQPDAQVAAATLVVPAVVTGRYVRRATDRMAAYQRDRYLSEAAGRQRLIMVLAGLATAHRPAGLVGAGRHRLRDLPVAASLRAAGGQHVRHRAPRRY